MCLCYIFDVDDTLIKYENFDFEEWYRFICEPVANELSVPMNLEIWRGMIEGKISRRYPERYGVSAEEFWRRVDARNLEYRKFMLREGRLKAYDDVSALSALRGKKIAWSTSSRNCMEFVLSTFNLLEHFDFLMGKDYQNYRYVEHVKPAPTFLLLIKDMFNCTSCIVVGDDEKDMKAARNAGCMAVLVTRRISHSRFADYVIQNLWELGELDKKFL